MARHPHPIDPLPAEDRQGQATVHTGVAGAHVAGDWEAPVGTGPPARTRVRWCDIPPPHTATAGRARGDPGGTPATAEAGVGGAGRPARRACGDAVPGGARRRAAAGPLPGSGHDAPAARGAGGGSDLAVRRDEAVRLQEAPAAVAPAAAITSSRRADWLDGVAPARTRCAHVAARAPAR